MSIDKISEERLFQNNSKEHIKRWCQGLRYFYYMRARGGHNCEGDSFCAYFKFNGREDLIDKLTHIGITLNKLAEGYIAYDPLESYSIEDLDKLIVTISQFNDLEQPRYVEISGYKAHIWIMDGRFEISVSGSKDGEMYKISDEDFEVCLALEQVFEKQSWSSILDEDIKTQIHCISKENYPELYQ